MILHPDTDIVELMAHTDGSLVAGTISPSPAVLTDGTWFQTKSSKFTSNKCPKDVSVITSL